MSDLATVGLRVENGQAVQAFRQHQAAADAAGRSTDAMTAKMAAANGGTARYAEIQRQAGQAVRETSIDLKATEARFDAMFGSQQRVTDSTRRMTMAHMEAIRMNDAMGASTGRMNLGLLSGARGAGRLSTAFAALTARLTGMSPILGTLAATLGGFMASSFIVAGVLAGIALLIKAWQHFTSEARKAKQEMDELRKGLQDRAASEYEDSIAGATERVSDMAAEVRRLNDEIERGGSLWEKFKFAVRNPLTDFRELGTGVGDSMRPDAARAGRDQRRAQLELDRIREREAADARRIAEKAAREAAAARALVFANEERVRLAEQELEKIGVTGVALEHMKLQHERMNDLLRARETMTGAQLAAYKEAVDAEMSIRVSIIAANEALKQQAKIRDEILEKQKKTEQNAHAEAKAAEEYAKDMQAIWREGIGKIVTDGTKSFADFFENVLRMFSKLMARMEKEGKDKGPLYNLLKMGGAAGAAGAAGYETGRQTTNRTMGALGGAASGAATGYAMAGPWGAAIGGITGFIGGIIGSGKAARQAAREMAELQKSLKLTMEGLRARDRGDDLGIAIAAVRAEFDALEKQIKDANKGRKNEPERFRLLDEANALEARRIELLRQEAEQLKRYASEDLEIRALVAQGRDKEAEAMRQAREVEEALRAKMGDAYIARLKEVQALEAIKKATDDVTRSQLNMVQGYRLQAAIFGAMSPRGPGGLPPRIAPPDGPRIHPDPIPEPIGGGDVPVTLVLQDGTSLGNAVLKNFHAQAQRTFGDSSRWAELN